MKSLLFVVVVVLGITTTSCSTGSTKVNCNCKICVACDSLDSICNTEEIDSMTDINGHRIPVHIHRADFNLWYDSLTNMIFDDISYHHEVMDSAQFIDYIYNEYYQNPKFMHELEMGFDGLCGDCYTQDPKAIDKFYDILDTFNKLHK